MFLVELAILIYSVILHEISHGYVADRLGDPTARLAKRLTLDPRPHIDPWMTILLPALLVLTGSPLIFGAAKPVPIDPFNFREPKKDTALTALAGPLTNIGIAVLLGLLFRVSDLLIINGPIRLIVQSILGNGVSLNIFLALFNLLPIPPLDGAKVLAGVLPDSLAKEIYALERYGFFIFIIILFLFQSQIFSIIAPIHQTILRAILH